ncbi:hypothetical protein Tco_1111344 [Tanacetum coccineum]|uniref:Uncharacterized protein n=1 Tax=Tanacetum coccineum TaxID=301880 RepID=A0ABQ5ILS8_9ASTR
MFQRLYLLETNKSCKVLYRCNNSNGSKTRSWAWRRPIRGGHEETQFITFLSLLEGFETKDKCDIWEYSLNPSKVFTVSSFRKNIEFYTLLSNEDHIRSNRLLPTKVNINSWRLLLDRLPTRHNLDARGIDCTLLDVRFVMKALKLLTTFSSIARWLRGFGVLLLLGGG